MIFIGKWSGFCGNECAVKRKEATFQEFKEFTRAVVRGERTVDPNSRR
jgi:hypothetical protein